MLRPRIVPFLLMKDGRLVKTIKFADPRYIGDPLNAVRIFNEKDCDELALIDIGATESAVEPMYDKIAQCAAECRMPLCYGGGIKNTDQIQKLISLGVEKVALCSAALEDNRIIGWAAEKVGKQSVVVSVDVKKDVGTGEYVVTSQRGVKSWGWKLREWLVLVEKMGAGEVLVNSIDRDGTMVGYDIELAKIVKESIGVPVNILGGAGSVGSIEDLLSAVGVVGAGAGSLFVFKGRLKAVLLSYPNESELLRLSLIAWKYNHAKALSN